MKPVIAIALAIMLYMPLAGIAQTLPCSAPNSEIIDVMTVRTDLQGANGQSVQIHGEVVIERSKSNGHISYQINIASIGFVGTGSVVDATPTSTMFGALAYASVKEGVARGHTLCPSSCVAPATTEVRQSACVVRNGTGVVTVFTQCVDPTCCERRYSVCCPSGQNSPDIQLLGSGSRCTSTGCESTCP